MTVTEKIKLDLKRADNTYLPTAEAKKLISGTGLQSANKKLTYKGQKRYDYLHIYCLPMLVEIGFSYDQSEPDKIKNRCRFGSLAQCLRYEPETKMSMDTGIKNVATKDWFEFHKLIPKKEKAFSKPHLISIFSDCKIKKSQPHHLIFVRKINTIEELFETFEQVVKLYPKVNL